MRANKEGAFVFPLPRFLALSHSLLQFDNRRLSKVLTLTVTA